MVLLRPPCSGIPDGLGGWVATPHLVDVRPPVQFVPQLPANVFPTIYRHKAKAEEKVALVREGSDIPKRQRKAASVAPSGTFGQLAKGFPQPTHTKEGRVRLVFVSNPPLLFQDGYLVVPSYPPLPAGLIR